MVKKGCEKKQIKREKKMECNMKAVHVDNQQNVFESQQYFLQNSSGAGGYKHQNTQMGHSKYPSNEQFYQRGGPVLSSQSVPGTVPNMQHVQPHQYKTPNYYANASQTVFQQVNYPAGVLKESSPNKKYNRNTNKMLLEYMHQQNNYMPAYYEYDTTALPQSLNGQFQPTVAYQKVQGHVPFANAGEVSGKKSGQNSNVQVPPPYSHLGSQMSYDVQSEWPPNLSSEFSTQTFNRNSVHPQNGESLRKPMQSQPLEQDQQKGHVQLPQEVLKLLQPKQLYKNADTNVQNQPSFYSDAQNIYYDWQNQPGNTSTENGCNNDILSSCEPRNANCGASFNPKHTGSNVSSQACTDLLQRVMRYGHEYTATSAPGNTQNLHMGTTVAQGNYSVYDSNGLSNNMVHSLNHTDNSKVSHEAMVQLRREVLGANDDYINALWHCKEKYEMLKSVHTDGNLPAADVHGSDACQNICGNGVTGDSWSVAPHAATSNQNPEALPSYKSACQQKMQSYSPREENYANQTSMGNTEGLYGPPNGQQLAKISPTLTTHSSHCAQDRNEPTAANPFSNYLGNKYQTSEEVNKTPESVEKTKSPLDFREGVQSGQSHQQCALASGLSSSTIKTQTNIQSGHPSLCTVPDRNGNPMAKESLKYSAEEQTCKPRHNEVSDGDHNLPSPSSKPTASESVESTMASPLGTGQARSLPSDIVVKREPSDSFQDMSHLDPCNNMILSTDGSGEQQAARDVDPKSTLPPRGLSCEQNDGILNKSQKAVCLNEKTNAVSGMDVNRYSDRAVTGRKPELFGINMKKTAEPQIAVVNPLTPLKSESPSKDQENVPPRNGIYHGPQEALRGPLSQQRKRKLAVVSANGNIDHMSSVNMLLSILDSEASVNCPGSQKIIPMACALNSKINVPHGKAKKSVPAMDSTKPLLQLKSNEFTQPQASPLCQEKPELKLGNGAMLLVSGACEEQLQISSVCTLVEGSTFYDSQMAKIFDADPLEQSNEPNIESEELVVLQRDRIMAIKNKTCEVDVHEAPPERPHLDQFNKGENHSNPVGRSNGSNQKLPVSCSEAEQTVLETLNENTATFGELSRSNEDCLSFNPIASQTEKDCCRNEGPLEEQMPNMADRMQEEMLEGDEAPSEPYVNSQLSELLRMFPFGIDTTETGAIAEESEVLGKDQDGSNFSQLQEHQPGQDIRVSSPVVAQAEKTQPAKQSEVEKGLQFTNDCNIRSPDIDPRNGDTLDKEKGKPKTKDFEAVSELKSEGAVQCEKLCSLEQPSIALLNSQHPGFLFPANARQPQPPCDANRKYREHAKELATMANVGVHSNQTRFDASVGMETRQPVSNFLLPVYSGEERGFYLNNMAANGRNISFKHGATYQNSVDRITDDHSYRHVSSLSQINANSEKNEGAAKFQFTHQGKMLQNVLPETGVGWQNIDWVNSAKKLNCLPVEQNLYRTSDARKSATCESKCEQNRLMLQHVTPPTAGGAQIAYGYQSSIFKEHPPNTFAYHKVDHKSPSPKKHKKQSGLVGQSKEKKKKTRLIVKTDFLKPKANKTKEVCQKTSEVHGVKLADGKYKVSESGCMKSMLSSDKGDIHSAKLGEGVQVALSDNAGCSMTDRGLIEEKQGIEERAHEESEYPQTLVHGAEDHLHNLAVQEFFQRRKAEQSTGGKKTQQEREKHKAKQPLQYRKPSKLFEKLEEGGKRKNEGGLEENLSKHPKKAPQKPMESIGENFLTRIAFTGYINGVIQLVNFKFLNSSKNSLSLTASKPIVTKKPGISAQEPEVLAFKLCSGELLGRHTADDKSAPVSQDNAFSKEIQHKTAASSSNIPLKKRKVDMALLQGNIIVPKRMLNQGIFSTEKACRPQTPNSKVLFSAFKKLYLERQSRKVA